MVPSVPVLARTPLAPLLDLVDHAIKKKNSEWLHLPPASLRMRIGVGNRLVRNHHQFIESGKAIVSELSGKNYLNPDSQILELGCGCGRNAIALKKYLSSHGKYIGQDVDKEMIQWCQQNLASQNFYFNHANVFSKVYNPKGQSVGTYCFPTEDQSISLIFSISVFSHLLYEDFLHYVGESARVLSKGGHLHMTLFIMDYLRSRLGDRWKFSNAYYKCFVESNKFPEAAVAYDLEVIQDILISKGFQIDQIYNQDLHQQTIIAKKL